MKKIKINMLSNADSVDGQGVGSASANRIANAKYLTFFIIDYCFMY